MGTSSTAPSAERDPDSLEREDDSLFPACLLELFLSHISPAKSPRSSSLAFSLQSLSHDLSSPTESALVRLGAPLIHRNKSTVLSNKTSVVKLSCLRCWTGSEGSIHIQSVVRFSTGSSNVPVTLKDQLDPCFGLYQYLFCAQSTLCCSLPCQTHTNTHTNMCTHKGYILIKTGA